MHTWDAQEAIKAAAKENGLTFEQTIKEIESSILEAMQNPDPAVRERWKRIPYAGDRPTAIEFVSYIRSVLHGK